MFVCTTTKSPNKEESSTSDLEHEASEKTQESTCKNQDHMKNPSVSHYILERIERVEKPCGEHNEHADTFRPKADNYSMKMDQDLNQSVE